MRFSVPVTCIKTGETTNQSAGRMLACLWRLFTKKKKHKTPHSQCSTITCIHSSHGSFHQTHTRAPVNQPSVLQDHDGGTMARNMGKYKRQMNEMLECFCHRFTRNYMRCKGRSMYATCFIRLSGFVWLQHPQW